MLNIQLIKNELKKQKISQSEFAKKIGVTRSCVTKYFSGVAKPTMDRYEEMLKILNLHNLSNINSVEAIKVPLLTYSQAKNFNNSLLLDDNENITYIPMIADKVPNNGFLISLVGDGMNYDFSNSQILNREYSMFHIFAGEQLLIDPNQTNINKLINKIVLADTSSGTTVKLVYQDEKGLCLMPLNSRLQNNEEIKRPDEARIIGQVVRVVNERDFS